MKPSDTNTAYPCPECEGGMIRAFRGAYTTTAGGQNVTIPNVEQESCDRCDLSLVTPDGSALVDAWLDEKLESITPGELRRFLSQYSLTQKEASRILGIGEKCLSRWIRGHQRVSTSMSRYIRLLLTSEESFRELCRSPAGRTWKPVDLSPEEKALLTESDYITLRKRGFLPETRKRNEKHQALCMLMKSRSLQEVLKWGESFEHSIAAFKDTGQAYSRMNGAIWLRMGMLAAESIPCARYDRDQVEKVANILRSCTEKEVATAFLLAQDLLSRAGVALVVVPKLKGSAYRGCTRLISPEKAVIVHALKFKNVSQFWRTLFHEIAHLVLHIESPDDRFIEYEDRNENRQEKEADAWAEELLVYGEKRVSFLARFPRAPVSEIQKASQELGIAPAIFVESLAREMPDKQHFYSKCRKAGIFPVLDDSEVEKMIEATKEALLTVP